MTENGTRTFAQYRTNDILIWLMMLLVFDALIDLAGSRWFPGQPYSVSLVPVMTALVFMRWGVRGLYLAVAGGLEYALMSGGTVQAILTYGVGNIFSIFGLVFLHFMGKNRVKENIVHTMVFALVTAVGMQAGRGLMSLVFGSGISSFAGFITTDALSGVFAAVILCICRKADGVFEDQKSYLIRMNKQEGDTSDDQR